MSRVLAVGEMLIDFTAQSDNTTVAQTPGFSKNPGGAPANVAVAVARLGQSSAFVGCVGSDPFGDFLRESIAGYGVDVNYVFTIPHEFTSLAFVARHGGDPDYFFLRNPGADVLLSPALVRQIRLDAQTILHFGSNSLAEVPIREAITTLVARARDEESIVSFDVNLRRAFWNATDSEVLAHCREMAVEADVLKVNREELFWLSGCDDVDQALHRLTDVTRAVIVCTLGGDGAAICLQTPVGDESTAPTVRRVEGFASVNVDATGAGDACIGAILARLLELGVNRAGLSTLTELDWAHLVRFGCAAAAITVTRIGAMNAMPTFVEVEAVLAGTAPADVQRV
ncbi:MAG: carbohydrate kinase [Firmicutes bacterium]|nr:carbohydrate kinase [Bacillota bacterium]